MMKGRRGEERVKGVIRRSSSSAFQVAFWTEEKKFEAVQDLKTGLRAKVTGIIPRGFSADLTTKLQQPIAYPLQLAQCPTLHSPCPPCPGLHPLPLVKLNH